MANEHRRDLTVLRCYFFGLRPGVESLSSHAITLAITTTRLPQPSCTASILPRSIALRTASVLRSTELAATRGLKRSLFVLQFGGLGNGVAFFLRGIAAAKLW